MWARSSNAHLTPSPADSQVVLKKGPYILISLTDCFIWRDALMLVLLPCQELCVGAVSACGAFMASLGLSGLLPNCSAVNSLTGTPLFPTTSCNNVSQDIGTPTKTLFSIAIVLLIASVIISTVVPYSQVDCPYPLKYNPKGTTIDPSGSLTSSDQICVYPCPDPMFTDTDWDGAEGLLTGLSSASLNLL